MPELAAGSTRSRMIPCENRFCQPVSVLDAQLSKISLKIEPDIESLSVCRVTYKTQRRAGLNAQKLDARNVPAHANLVVSPAPREGGLGSDE